MHYTVHISTHTVCIYVYHLYNCTAVCTVLQLLYGGLGRTCANKHLRLQRTVFRLYVLVLKRELLAGAKM